MASDHRSDDHGRVDPAALVANAPVKVRSCGPSRHAHLSDHLTTTNDLSAPEALTFQMAVDVLVATGGDDNSCSAEAVIDRFHDPARPPAEYRRSQRRSNIQSGMGLRSAVWTRATTEVTGVTLEDGDRKDSGSPALVCCNPGKRQQQSKRESGEQISESELFQSNLLQSNPRA